MIAPTNSAPLPQLPQTTPSPPAPASQHAADPVLRRDALQISPEAQALLAAEQGAEET